MNGAAGIMGGTKLDAIFGVADENPVTAAAAAAAAGGGIPSFEAICLERSPRAGVRKTQFAIAFDHSTITTSINLLNLSCVNTSIHNS